jgi:cytosine/adenosine deaminase-related metal-dependent hydrolase
LGNARIAPVRDFRRAGVPVGLGCDGSASTDSASLWMEARNAMLLGRMRHGPDQMSARDALEVATRGGAACLGRSGELGELRVGAVGDVVVWPMDGLAFAGALSDPIAAWLRCGPTAARHTVINGRLVVRNGQLVSNKLEERLVQHRQVATRMQAS